MSVLTNYASTVLALVFAGVANVIPRLGSRAPQFYTAAIRLTMLGTLVLSLTHLHVGGVHSSLVGLVLLIQMVITRWFVPHGDVPWFYSITALSAVSVLYLEYNQTLQYAPMSCSPRRPQSSSIGDS